MCRVSTRIWLSALLAVSLSVGGSGCFTREIGKLFKAEEPVNVDAVAKFWNGPRIGPGMNLNITVGAVAVNTTSMSVLVDQKGDVTIQYLLEHPVHCDGMTLEEFKAALVKEYSEYIRQPVVTVTFGSYDGHGVSPWGTVTVMGEVGTQGPVNMPPTMDLTVTKVLQLAGGAKPYGDTTRIRVMRCDKDGNQTTYKVDLREIGEDGRFDKDMLLKAGDVVYIPERWF